MQESKFNSFKDTMGLDLLINHKKKQGGSDTISLNSSEDDKISVRSGSIHSGSASIRSVNIKSSINGNNDYETESNASYESDISSQSNREQREKRYSQKKERKYDSNRERERENRNRSRENRDEDGSQIDSLGSIMQEERRLSEDEIIVLKNELLYQFERLEKKGMKLPRKFTLSSNLEEMKNEFARLKRDKEVDSSINFQKRMLIGGISGIEWFNSKFDPIGAKLDGWGDTIYESIDDYNDIFEDLHNKYKGKANFPPEVKLVMMLGGSAFMHHMTHTMFKDQLPGLDSILKQNPELKRQLAAATSQHMADQQTGAGNLFGGLGNMFSGFFGGGQQQGQQQNDNNYSQNNQPPVYIPNPQMSTQNDVRMNSKVNMKGPSNVDYLLREFDNINIDNDRIEQMSIMTESEIEDIVDDSSSINGLIVSKKQKGKKNNKITLDLK